MDVVLRIVRMINIAGLDADVGADELFADGSRADELDVHAVNFRTRSLRPCKLRAAEQQPDSEKAKKQFHRWLVGRVTPCAPLAAFAAGKGLPTLPFRRNIFIADFCCAFKSSVIFQER